MNNVRLASAFAHDVIGCIACPIDLQQNVTLASGISKSIGKIEDWEQTMDLVITTKGIVMHDYDLIWLT